jgi:hypothetical protein
MGELVVAAALLAAVTIGLILLWRRRPARRAPIANLSVSKDSQPSRSEASEKVFDGRSSSARMPEHPPSLRVLRENHDSAEIPSATERELEAALPTLSEASVLPGGISPGGQTDSAIAGIVQESAAPAEGRQECKPNQSENEIKREFAPVLPTLPATLNVLDLSSFEAQLDPLNLTGAKDKAALSAPAASVGQVQSKPNRTEYDEGEIAERVPAEVASPSANSEESAALPRTISIDLANDAIAGSSDALPGRSPDEGPRFIDDSTTESHEHITSRKPSAYRPPTAKPSKPRAGKRSTTDDPKAESALDVRVNASLDRHGHCSFRLIARKPDAAPPDMDVRQGRRLVVFSEVGDEWYEVNAGLSLPEWIAGVLFNESVSMNGRSWQLSSREVHILAAQPGVAGFTSTTRLTLGRKHLILCQAQATKDLEPLLAEAGCGTVRPYGEDFGAPIGWFFYGPVVPTLPVPILDPTDYYNIFRPQPEVNLVFSGGIRLSESSWLDGFPPSVAVEGLLSISEPIYIDQEIATADDVGRFTVTEMARVGSHVVSCAGKNRSYEIVEPSMRWEQWDAHSFPLGSICGAKSNVKNKQLITVPVANRILVGAVPGQIYRCPITPGRQWSGFAPFVVAWAVPENPLQSRATSEIVVLEKELPTPVRDRGIGRGKPTDKEREWCQLIRDCHKKRLSIRPSSPEAKELWRSYNVLARNILRRRK